MLWGVSIYSFATARPQTVEQLVALARDHRLQSLEADMRLLGQDPGRVKRLLADHRLACVLAGGQLLRTDMEALLSVAQQIGARAIRLTLSSVLEGDRRKVEGGNWEVHLSKCHERLKQIAPLAEKAGIPFALENHQDLTADELVWLCEESGNPFVGICLDTGNPLSVMQHPVSFAETVAPFVRDVHLKDYQVYTSPNGSYLKRCALGEGIVDIPQIIRSLVKHRNDLPLHIELGATRIREIRWLDKAWWGTFAPRSPQELARVVPLMCEHQRPGDYRTPHERQESEEAQRGYEMKEFEESVAYIRNPLSSLPLPLAGEGGVRVDNRRRKELES